jgi:hypothetical protein
MEENRNIQNALKNLPVHLPDPAVWSRIDVQLPVAGKAHRFMPLLNRLPQRQPAEAIWYSIVRELDNRNRRRIFYLATFAAAALFAMYFGISDLLVERKPLQQQTSRETAKKDQAVPSSLQRPSTTFSPETGSASAKTTISPAKKGLASAVTGSVAAKTATKSAKTAILQSSSGQTIMQKPDQPSNAGRNDAGKQLAQQPDLTDTNKLIIQPVNTPQLAQNVKPKPVDSADKPLQKVVTGNVPLTQKVAVVKRYPADTIPVKPKVSPTVKKPETLIATNTTIPAQSKKIAIGLDFLSQPFDNGVNQTHLQNLNLSATLKKNKVRFYSGIGYAYTSERSASVRQDKMAYAASPASMSYTLVNSSAAVTGAMDAYSAAKNSLPDPAVQSLFTSLVASPVPANHPFLTYDLGASARLFGNERISGWATAGSGIALKLDRKSSRETDIAAINTILANNQSPYAIPYNNYKTINLSLITGFQLDYCIIKRISLLVEPSARFYLFPLFDGYLNRTDSFSLGIKTGLKYDLK